MGWSTATSPCDRRLSTRLLDVSLRIDDPVAGGTNRGSTVPLKQWARAQPIRGSDRIKRGDLGRTRQPPTSQSGERARFWMLPFFFQLRLKPDKVGTHGFHRGIPRQRIAGA